MKKIMCWVLALLFAWTCVPVVCARAEYYPGIPVLSELYPEVEAPLREFTGDKKENRRAAYAGPGSEYPGAGSYKPYKQRGVTALFIQGEWVFTHLKYQTVNDRFLYFKLSGFEKQPSVPEVTELEYISGTITAETSPCWGPGTEYETEPEYKVSAGEAAQVYFQENGYFYVGFNSIAGQVMMWLPADMVALDISIQPQSSDAQGDLLFQPTWEWSEWQDQEVEETEELEVETRTLCRKKSEIKDWTDWIDGDPPYEEGDPNCEIRYVSDEDGEMKAQWRYYDFHYHYGDWSDWALYSDLGTIYSTDVLEYKTQYRFRLK